MDILMFQIFLEFFFLCQEEKRSLLPRYRYDDSMNSVGGSGVESKDQNTADNNNNINQVNINHRLSQYM